MHRPFSSSSSSSSAAAASLPPSSCRHGDSMLLLLLLNIIIIIIIVRALAPPKMQQHLCHHRRAVTAHRLARDRPQRDERTMRDLSVHRLIKTFSSLSSSASPTRHAPVGPRPAAARRPDDARRHPCFLRAASQKQAVPDVLRSGMI